MQRLLRTSLDHSVLQNDQGRRDKQELKRSDETTAPLWIAYDSVFCGPLIFDPPKYCVINGLELAHYWKKSNCIITYCVGGSFIGHVLMVVYVVVCTGCFAFLDFGSNLCIYDELKIIENLK